VDSENLIEARRISAVNFLDKEDKSICDVKWRLCIALCIDIHTARSIHHASTFMLVEIKGNQEIKKSRNQEIKKSRNQEIKKSRNQEIKKSRNQEIKKSRNQRGQCN